MATRQGIDARTGARVRALREARGLTREELAELASRSPTFLGKIERGEGRVSTETWDLLARALGVELPELFAAEPRAEETRPRRGTHARESELRHVSSATESKVQALSSYARSLDAKALTALVAVARAMAKRPGA